MGANNSSHRSVYYDGSKEFEFIRIKTDNKPNRSQIVTEAHIDSHYYCIFNVRFKFSKKIIRTNPNNRNEQWIYYSKIRITYKVYKSTHTIGNSVTEYRNKTKFFKGWEKSLKKNLRLKWNDFYNTQGIIHFQNGVPALMLLRM